jgi:hypothetical protein
MKFIAIAALTLATSASASDLWLDSVHGDWNCNLTDDNQTATMFIDSVISHITVKRNGKTYEGTLVDRTETLSVEMRDKGIHFFAIAEDKTEKELMFKAPDGTLQIQSVNRSVPDTFSPHAICTKVNN